MFCKKRRSQKLRKIHWKTPVLGSLFNKVADLYPATSLKERTPTKVLSDNFCQILKTELLQATASVLRKNILPTNSKELSEKRKVMDAVCKKNNDMRRTKT